MFPSSGLFQEVSNAKEINTSLRKNSSFKIFGKEWLAVCFSGCIKGPLAYIFSGVVVSSISHEIAGETQIAVDSPNYRKIRPLYIVQLVVLISLVVLSPINYLIFKGTVEPSHDDHDEEDETEMQYIKPDKWEIDHQKPKVFSYADEFLFKPIFIRSYHQRSKVLGVLKAEFEKAAKMYEHGHHDEGHGHGHGHDDHGHGHDEGHGHEDHGHGEDQEEHQEVPHGEDNPVVIDAEDDVDPDFNVESDHVL